MLIQSENHFFYLQHHQALFVVVFSPKTNNEKFEFLDQNHGLTLWKSITFYTLKNCRFRSLKFFIYTNMIKHYSSWYFRPSALRTTFCATHYQCLRNFLGRPSISSLVLIPRFRVCPRGRPERNAGCPTVVCYSRQITSPITFEFDYHCHDISYFAFFCLDLLDCFMISPRDV